MLFVVIANDKPGTFGTRKATREAHLAWLKGLGPKIKIAGPFLDSSQSIMNGSLLIIEAENEAVARALAAEDPYARAGVFQRVEIKPWRWVVNPPEA
jgi:uncharacterized protein